MKIIPHIETLLLGAEALGLEGTILQFNPDYAWEMSECGEKTFASIP
jgi:hypothetical protein